MLAEVSSTWITRASTINDLISFLRLVRSPTSLARCRTSSRSSRLAGGAIQASGNRPIRNHGGPVDDQTPQHVPGAPTSGRRPRPRQQGRDRDDQVLLFARDLSVPFPASSAAVLPAETGLLILPRAVSSSI